MATDFFVFLESRIETEKCDREVTLESARHETAVVDDVVVVVSHTMSSSSPNIPPWSRDTARRILDAVDSSI